MLDLAAITQYYPGNSLLHRLDPRTKVLGVLAYSILIFVPKGWTALGASAVMAALCVAAGRVRPGFLFRGLRTILFFLIFTMALNIFLTPGEVVWQYGILKVTREGLELAVFVGVRLVLLISVTSLLTLTTSPIALTDGLERLMRPFRAIGWPAAEVALMMTIALRFVPTLLEEAERIIKAQEARGAQFAQGNIAARVKALVPVLVPLFVAAFRRADDLAVAMEARGYRGGHRTRMRELEFSRRDAAAGAVLAAFAGLVLWMRIAGV